MFPPVSLEWVAGAGLLCAGAIHNRTETCIARTQRRRPSIDGDDVK